MKPKLKGCNIEQILPSDEHGENGQVEPHCYHNSTCGEGLYNTLTKY